ncbi:protein kilB [Streptomyces sp. S1]|uniref:protein kilB n=1 Tax=Streptomyces sp. S1 TaxID=718288 RepID=UPI000EF81CF4|nr:protein kilB [Streptomyces sp. S1]
MFATVAAILGTLAGALLSGVLTARQARTALRDSEATARRQAAVDAVADLAAAVAAHRSAMWHRENKRLTGEDWSKDREHSHTTRAAISALAVRLAILAPALRPAAEAAVQASYALRGAGTEAELDAAREASLAADDRLITEAGHLLGV